MKKPRPPEHHVSSYSDKRISNLSIYTNLKLRQFLRKAPNDYPRFFYKYLSCDMMDEYIRCLLIDSDFYLSSCKEFNDPFDTTANVINNGSLRDMRKRFGQIIDANSPNINRKKRDLEISRLMSSYSRDPDAYRRILEQNTQHAGIFSLTENPRDILMWSHYASQHKGFLLQFEVAKDPETLLYALKMDYSNDYPSYDVSKGFDESFRQIMLRKSEHWKYENEWRILRIGGAGTYQRFKHGALTSLIFGCRTEEKFRDKVIGILKERESLGHPTVRVYKAEKHKSQYALKYFKPVS